MSFANLAATRRQRQAFFPELRQLLTSVVRGNAGEHHILEFVEHGADSVNDLNGTSALTGQVRDALAELLSLATAIHASIGIGPDEIGETDSSRESPPALSPAGAGSPERMRKSGAELTSRRATYEHLAASLQCAIDMMLSHRARLVRFAEAATTRAESAFQKTYFMLGEAPRRIPKAMSARQNTLTLISTNLTWARLNTR